MTNLMACGANEPTLGGEIDQLLIQKGLTVDSFEYFFNKAQSQLKMRHFTEAVTSILKAKERAERDGEFESDLARFKTQELHMLNSMVECFLQVEYKQGSEFELPKNLTHNSLVELNMNALRGTFSVNELQFKELIGHMNWKKFSDRIQEQLATNQNLTKEQKQLMEVNAIIALMRSHQFDKAQNAIKKAGLDCHPAITGLRVYFLMKDKKYEEALATIS